MYLIETRRLLGSGWVKEKPYSPDFNEFRINNKRFWVLKDECRDDVINQYWQEFEEGIEAADPEFIHAINTGYAFPHKMYTSGVGRTLFSEEVMSNNPNWFGGIINYSISVPLTWRGMWASTLLGFRDGFESTLTHTQFMMNSDPYIGKVLHKIESKTRPGIMRKSDKIIDMVKSLEEKTRSLRNPPPTEFFPFPYLDDYVGISVPRDTPEEVLKERKKEIEMIFETYFSLFLPQALSMEMFRDEGNAKKILKSRLELAEAVGERIDEIKEISKEIQALSERRSIG